MFSVCVVSAAKTRLEWTIFFTNGKRMKVDILTWNLPFFPDVIHEERSPVVVWCSVFIVKRILVRTEKPGWC